MFTLVHDSSSDDDDDTRPTSSTSTNKPLTSSVPFPSKSPNDHLHFLSSPKPTRPTVPRTTSTPILLSNGKPLKSSLKSSSSSPNICIPSRTQSAPSTPLLMPQPKNVHFPSQEEGGLVSVRVFNRSAKPVSLSRALNNGFNNNNDDTGTETETENEFAASSSYFWPASSSLSMRSSSYFKNATCSPRLIKQHHNKRKMFELDSTKSSPVPRFWTDVSQAHFANLHLETLTLVPATSLPPSLSASTSSLAPPSRPVLRGTILVRNLAYEKHVGVRFTLDDWQTTSEVVAHHVTSLPRLPDAFLAACSSASAPRSLTLGDLAATAAPEWDRFLFTINLEDCALNLEHKTMWLVVKYSAPAASGTAGGAEAAEWWDNNGGANYKLAFKVASPEREERENSTGLSTSPAVKLTPSVSAPKSPVSGPSGDAAVAQFSSLSFPPSSVHTARTVPAARSQQHQEAVAQTTFARLKKLTLSNYVAPSSTSNTPTASPQISPTASPIMSRRSSTAGDNTLGVVTAAGEGSSTSGSSRDSTPMSSPRVSLVGLHNVAIKAYENFERYGTGYHHDLGLDMGISGGSGPGIDVGMGMMHMQDGHPATSGTGATLDEGGLVGGPSGTTFEYLGTSPPFSMLSQGDGGFGGRGRLELGLGLGRLAGKESEDGNGSVTRHGNGQTRMSGESAEKEDRLMKVARQLEHGNGGNFGSHGGGSKAGPYATWGPPAHPPRRVRKTSPLFVVTSDSGDSAETDPVPLMSRSGIRESDVEPLLNVIREKNTSSPVRSMSGSGSGSSSGSSSGSDSETIVGGEGRSRVADGALFAGVPSALSSSAAMTQSFGSWGRGEPHQQFDVRDGTGASVVDRNESVYQAFVRQWCFAQGPNNGPGVEVR